MTKFCEVWLLAHYLQINPLMNYAIYLLISMMDSGHQISFGDMEDLYDKAPVESILRTFLVHLCVWGNSQGGKEKIRPTSETPHDMLRDFVLEYQRKGHGEESPLGDVRNYYNKDQGATVPWGRSEILTQEMCRR